MRQCKEYCISTLGDGFGGKWFENQWGKCGCQIREDNRNMSSSKFFRCYSDDLNPRMSCKKSKEFAAGVAAGSYDGNLNCSVHYKELILSGYGQKKGKAAGPSPAFHKPIALAL